MFRVWLWVELASRLLSVDCWRSRPIQLFALIFSFLTQASMPKKHQPPEVWRVVQVFLSS